MSVTTPLETPSKTLPETKFWIICREENQLTQDLAREISDWQIPGVRASVDHQMSLSLSDAMAQPGQSKIAQADYAIFVTLCEHPCSHIQLHPVSNGQPNSERSPMSFLNTLRQRHGSAPQSWWLQLPLTEIRHQDIRHIPTAQTLSKALTQIEVFVRNYYLQPQLRQNTAYQKMAQQRSPMQTEKVQTEKVLQVA